MYPYRSGRIISVGCALPKSRSEPVLSRFQAGRCLTVITIKLLRRPVVTRIRRITRFFDFLGTHKIKLRSSLRETLDTVTIGSMDGQTHLRRR